MDDFDLGLDNRTRVLASELERPANEFVRWYRFEEEMAHEIIGEDGLTVLRRAFGNMALSTFRDLAENVAFGLEKLRKSLMVRGRGSRR